MSEQRGLLNDGSPLPAYTATPSFATRHRPGYQRVASVSFNDTPDTRDITDPTDEIEPAPSGAGHNHGLGISSGSAAAPATPSRPGQSSLQRDSTSNLKSTPEHGTPVHSPPSTGALTGSTRFDETFDTAYNPSRLYKESRTSLNSANNAPSVYAKSDAGLLSVRSRYDEFAPQHNCQSTRKVKHGRFASWLSIGILFLAVFATVFSAAFLIIAIKGPKYGRAIRNGGPLSPSSAAFLTSLFAKMIELAYVTVVVAFVGQALARRAFKLERARGVTLAELNMRSWIMQPGVMITQWESVRYAGISILGLISFLAALMAILYTSAATALVQPQLVIPNFEHKVMSGLVKSQFANPQYIGKNCQTPVTDALDRTYVDTTCLQIEHSAMAFVNYRTFLANWDDAAQVYGNSSNDLAKRPKGYALFNDNTTIIAPWVERTSPSHPQPNPGYLVNNITMAMPHVGVVQAAMDPINDLVQPWEVEGASYNIRASVPSPVVNVLCATLTETQLEPFIYQKWNQPGCNTSTWIDWPACLTYPNGTYPYLNNADQGLYDVFRWGEKYGSARYPPVFARLPKDFNTVVNDTKGMRWGATSIYLLGKSDTYGPVAGNYSLCEIKAGQTPNCYTTYNATGSGGEMEAVCESDHILQYNNSEPLALSGNATLSKDWVNIGSEWSRALSLNAGQFDGNASNARLLTQFILSSENTGNLSAGLPSTAEALAVLAGNTLMQASQDAPFVMFWNYTNPTIDGSYQQFNASVRVQQYASGGNQDYQKPFYLVLIIVFLMNLFILGYFALHRDWYTDFSDPIHLVSLPLVHLMSYVLAY
ncbi:hypothetical protein AC578_7412 [Pseudocercospora eumusae]|uniref:Uncharacterized protein n=1 Tax=Pseudocercospora eumusae TaxID=321146 RepID=A0A139H2X9_9PEZI|nr:hypothetical protein AC578_7412 [Pseudocercospora eumusae]